MNYLKIFIALIVFNECNDESSVSSIESESFTLKFSEMIQLIDTPSGETIEILFDGDINDERCPQSACETCFGSLATIDLKIKLLSNENLRTQQEILSISILGCNNSETCTDSNYSVDRHGYRFCLMKLNPNKTSDINKNDYSAQINIKKL